MKIENMEYLPLTEVLETIVDNRGKTVPTSDTGIKLIATNCILNNRLFPIYERIRYVSKETYNTWFRSHLKPGDIIFVNKGGPGKVCMVPDNLDFCIAQDMVGLRVKKDIIYNKFLFAYLRTPDVQNFIKSNIVGSLIPHFKKEQFKTIMIPILPMKDQIKIGNLYYNICFKEELNNKINSNLFELMKRTYIEWFKNYNIPDLTFKLKDSELGKIPDDWNVKHLKDVFLFQEGPGIRNWQYVENDGTKFINIRCIKDNDLELDNANMISNEEAQGKYKHFMLNEWDVVVSTSGTLGRNQIIRKEHLPLCLNTSVIRFKPINGFNEYAFMYNYLISDEFLNLLDVMATGSAQRNFGPMHLNKIDLVYPNKDIIIRFNNLMFPIIENIQNNKAENMKLAQLRDTLLPKLMNGEIDLDNIEI